MSTEKGITTACINYTLSSKDAPERVHPCHIKSAASVIADLAKCYQKLYLIGHSAGAHLASLLVLEPKWLLEHENGLKTWQQIEGVIGVEGIYDIPKLIRTHGHIPMYLEFTTMAFTADESIWRSASPQFMKLSPSVLLPAFLVIHSLEDELVSRDQADDFYSHLKRLHLESSSSKMLELNLQLKGSHDGILKTSEFHQALADFILK